MNTYVFIKKYFIEDYYTCESVFSFCSTKTKEQLVEFINSSFEEFKKRVSEYETAQIAYWENPEIVEFNKQQSNKSSVISQKRKILDKKYSKIPKKDRTPEYNQEINKLKQEIDVLFTELQSIQHPKTVFPVLNKEFVLDDFSVSFSRGDVPDFEILTLNEWLEKYNQNKIYF